MRIGGKLGLTAVKDLMIAFCLAFIIGLIIYGIFALISLISWILAWMLIAIILTPVMFWIKRFIEDKIYIDIEPEDDEDNGYVS